MKIKQKSVRQLFYVLLLIPFVRLEAFTHVEAIEVFYDWSKIIACSLVFILELVYYLSTRELPDKFICLVILLFCWSSLSVIVHKTSIVSFLASYITMMALPFLLDYVFKKKDVRNFCAAAKSFFKALIIANFALLLFFPNGIYQEESRRIGFSDDTPIAVHLLGKANATTSILMAMTVMIVLSAYVDSRKLSKSDKLCIFSALLSIILQFSATGIVGLVAFFALLVCFLNQTWSRRISKYVSFKFFLIVALLGTIAVCFFNLQNHFSFIWEAVFDKDVTLSNRTNVWSLSASYIYLNFDLSNYILGSGLFSYSVEIFNGRYAHCHNQFIDVFIKSGLVGVLIYISLFWISIHVMSRQYKKTRNREIVFISAIIFSFVIMFIAEVYTTPLIMLVLYIGFRFSDLSPRVKAVTCETKNITIEQR